jgi:hypothetical protein
LQPLLVVPHLGQGHFQLVVLALKVRDLRSPMVHLPAKAIRIEDGNWPLKYFRERESQSVNKKRQLINSKVSKLRSELSNLRKFKRQVRLSRTFFII